MARRRIVILGGGSGGIVTANRLGYALGRDHDVTLVDKRPQHHYMSSFLWMARGWREPRDVTRDLTRLERKHVRFVNDWIVHVDTDRRIVTTRGSELPYDYLVVSLGLETRPDEIPGDSQLVHHTWELEAAVRFRDALRQFQGGRIVIGVPTPPWRCPPGPYEAAWLIDDDLRQRGIRDASQIDFFLADSGPFGGSGQPAEFATEHFARRGIRIHPSFTIESVDGARRVVRSRDGRELPFDLLFVVPPHRPVRVLAESGLVQGGGVPVDPDTLHTPWENVWAIGDATDLPVSKAGVVAHQQGDVVAHNLGCEIAGHGTPTRLRLHTI